MLHGGFAAVDPIAKSHADGAVYDIGITHAIVIQPVYSRREFAVLKILSGFLLLVAMLTASTASEAALTEGSSSPPVERVSVVEFYSSALDHYFITADGGEIDALDSGQVSGWVRTGFQFGAYSSESVIDLNPVCRFYGLPSAGLDSHFYSASPAECAAANAKFQGIWVLESDDVFRIRLPDLTTGRCAAGTVPVYRVFNNRSDANHRYTTDVSVRQQMIAKGGVPEGYGPDGVTFCANPAPANVGPTLPTTILATQLAPDMFSFSSTVAGIALGASVASYAWAFGDGTVGTGPVVEHQFAAPGDYVVTLAVRDDRGNRGLTSKRVTVSPAGSPGPGTSSTPGSGSSGGDDFDVRRSAPGVVRSFDFDSPAQLGSKTYRSNVWLNCGTKTCATIDTAVKASGAGSIRFDIPTRSNDNASGSWSAEFSPDLSLRFGENSEFFVQWRQRFNQAYLDTKILDTNGKPQGGFKQVIIGPGNTATTTYNSCEASHVVLTTYYQTRIPIGYNSCTGSASHRQPYEGFYETVLGANGSPTDYLIQNGPSLNCSFRTGGPKCIRWVANEWMTFKIWIKTGPRNNVTHEFDNSEYKLWIAREGQPAVLAVWWRPGIPGYFPLTAGTASDPNQSFGKITLTPYMTNKSATQDHPLLQTWYDDLIISREDIPDPAAGRTSKLAAVAPSTAVNLGQYRPQIADGDNIPAAHTTDYSGMQYDANRRQMVLFGGGHAGSNNDAIERFDLETLTWSSEYKPTPQAFWTQDNYDATLGAWRNGPDGPYPRPASRHTLDELVVAGDELIVLAKVEGNGPNLAGRWNGAAPNTLSTYSNGRVAHYNFMSKTWSFSPTATGATDSWPAAALDPVSGKILMVSRDQMAIYDPATKTKEVVKQIGDGAMGANQNLVYFPPTDKFYYVHQFGAVWEITFDRVRPAASTITRLQVTGPTPGSAAPETGIAFDSVNHVIGMGPIKGTFYTFDPNTGAWTASKIAGLGNRSTIFHCIDFDPIDGVFVFISDDFGTWAYRAGSQAAN